MPRIRFIKFVCLATCLAIPGLLASTATASIYEWEYINPSDPSQGKRESAVLLSLAAIGPFLDLQGFDLKKAYLRDAEISLSEFNGSDLTEAYLVGADVSSTAFNNAVLLNADLTDANIVGADFNNTVSSGFTSAQLASTASYAQGRLESIRLGQNNLSGWDLSRQSMRKAVFQESVLQGANFEDSILVRAVFDSADLAQANLTNATLILADLTSADLTGADLHGADLRGSLGLTREEITLVAGDIQNMIGPDSAIRGGLFVANGETQLFRDRPQFVIAGSNIHEPTVYDSFEIESGGVLRFDLGPQLTSQWLSPIHFDQSVSVVNLSGSLEVDYDVEENGFLPIHSIGVIKFFDWTGTTIEGTFDEVVLDPVLYGWNYRLDASNLYTSGEVTLYKIPEPAAGMLIGAGCLCLLRRKH